MSIIKPLKNYRTLELKEMPLCVTINIRDDWYSQCSGLVIDCSTLDAYESYLSYEKYSRDKLVFTHINDVKYCEKIYLCINVFWKYNCSNIVITKATESQLPPRIHKTCPSLYTDRLCNGPTQCQFIHHYKKM
jgi:hypothetical protein